MSPSRFSRDNFLLKSKNTMYNQKNLEGGRQCRVRQCHGRAKSSGRRCRLCISQNLIDGAPPPGSNKYICWRHRRSRDSADQRRRLSSSTHIIQRAARRRSAAAAAPATPAAPINWRRLTYRFLADPRNWRKHNNQISVRTGRNSFRAITEIRQSTIPNSGRGLFALVQIPKNAAIGLYTGRQLGARDFVGVTEIERYARTHDKVLALMVPIKPDEWLPSAQAAYRSQPPPGTTRNTYVDGETGVTGYVQLANEAKFLRQGRNATCTASGTLRAAKAISPGTEILWNYGDKYGQHR